MPAPNSQQQAVIDHDSGPILVIAGPGAGKTQTIVERIAHLVADKGVKPEELFVATFTEKAASELVSRITRKLAQFGVSVNIDDMYVGTFHSICLRLLEEHRDYTRLKKNYRVMDQFDQSFFFFQRISEFEKIAPVSLLTGKEKIARWQRANYLCGWMNTLAEEAIDTGRLVTSDDESLRALGKWRDLYDEMLEKENMLDFSVIQLETLRLLENHPDAVLAPLKARFKHLMVDEYQDTNTIQERLLFTLLNEDQNICVVGDDDQGLYRFRGATIRNILEFPSRFPAGRCKVHTLTVNYRSDPGIIEFYNRWMDGSVDGFSWAGAKGVSFRYPKTIVPPAGKEGIPTPVIKVRGQDSIEVWQKEVLAFLHEMKTTYLSDWNEVAFLFRSVKWDKAKALAQYLENNGIPIHAPRSDLYFERNEVMLMLGAFLFLFPIFGNIQSKWSKQWGNLDVWDYYARCLNLFADKSRDPANKELKDWCVNRAREISDMPIRNKPLDFSFSNLFYLLLQFPLFADMLDSGESDRDERPARNLAIFSQLVVKFEYLHRIQVLHPYYLERNVSDFFNHYFRYVIGGGIGEYEDANDYAPKGAVSFMTIHQSKGLEFPITVVDSLYVTPRNQSDDIGELLEAHLLGRPPFEPRDRIKGFDFKRLYYTAFSRAKNLLVLSCMEQKTVKGKLKVPTTYFQPFYNPLPLHRPKPLSGETDLTGLKVDEMKSAAIKNSYSYTSHILVYEGCPRQYQFFKHWEFAPVREGPMLFGLLVHQTIEDIHKAVLRGEPQAITQPNIERWFEANYANLSQRERVYLAPRVQDVALGHVLRYVERKNGDWSDIQGTEVDVSLVRDEYILKGRIDLIKGKGDTVEIVDFKAIPKPNQYAEKYLVDRFKRQLEIYAWLVEQMHGLEVSAMNIYYTGEEDGVPTYHFTYKRESVDATIAGVDKVIGRMESGEFQVCQRTPKLCKECDLKPFCDRR